MVTTIILIIAAVVVLLLILLFGGLMCYCNHEHTFTYNLDTYAGVYYYPESKGLDYFVFRADSTYQHFYISGPDTSRIDGRWTTGREKTYAFSIPEIDFFHIHFFRWADGEISSALDSVAAIEGDTLYIDNEPFMMKAYDWNVNMISLPIQNYRRHTIDFLRVRDLEMADSLGIKIKEEDFVPLPQNIDSTDFHRVWVDCN